MSKTQESAKKRKFVIVVAVVATFLLYFVGLFFIDFPIENKEAILALGGTITAMMILAVGEYIDGKVDGRVEPPNTKKLETKIISELIVHHIGSSLKN